jgi:hypothetical protein
MSSIQKTWGELVTAFNVASQIVQNVTQQLKAMDEIAKSDKSKEEVKKTLESNAKQKPILEETARVYSAFLEKVKDVTKEHSNKIDNINIDYALETEVTPGKDGKPGTFKLVLDEKGNYCYSREGEKGKLKAMKELNESKCMMPQLEITTTLTEKHELFEGMIVFKKSVEKTRSPLKAVSKGPVKVK